VAAAANRPTGHLSVCIAPRPGTTRSFSAARWAPGAAPRYWPGCSRTPAPRRCWPWPPDRTPAKGSTARPWTPCFLAAPVASKGSLTQYVDRILRSHENKTAAEVHDYLDERTGVLAAMLVKRAPGYTGFGFPDPRKTALTPSVSTDSSPTP
jgi:hypothetical protein